MSDGAEETAGRASRQFTPIGALVFVAALLILIVAAWVGMYLLLLHRGGVQ